MLKLEIKPYNLDFKFHARTSRGEIDQRKVWFIKVSDESGKSGLGEVAPIDRLSPEAVEDVPDKLEELARVLKRLNAPETKEDAFKLAQQCIPIQYPSLRFGLETALLDLVAEGQKNFFNNNLQELSIPINGLVWMGDIAFMKEQIATKLDEGFSCIKLKIGALDFDAEVKVIKELRSVSEELVIRLDANGAFQTNEVLSKLKVLSKYDIHSIEQPILPMQPEAMEIVCSKSQIPIAFDEELIHVFSSRDRMELIQELKPHYLVLKPTLHGGLGTVSEWIDLAEMHSVGWWITSYLESNIGLNAIAQFTSLYENQEYHGLGTGGLYTNNIKSPIKIEEGKLTYAASEVWEDIDF
ncbi:MAG: o-succinylbenzoate synthase [Ekhidna sp.]